MMVSIHAKEDGGLDEGKGKREEYDNEFSMTGSKASGLDEGSCEGSKAAPTAQVNAGDGSKRETKEADHAKATRRQSRNERRYRKKRSGKM